MYRLIGNDGREYGPVDAATVRRWVLEGRANARTRVWPGDAGDYRPLGTVPEFSLLFAAPAAPSSSYYPYPRRTHPLATASLVMGLLAFLGCCCCCFSAPLQGLGIIFAIIAIVQAAREPVIYDGAGLAWAGLILCLLGLLFSFGFSFLNLAMSWNDVQAELNTI